MPTILASIGVGLLLLSKVQAQPGHAFYVDGVNGNDANTGQGVTRAWRTIPAVNQHRFLPGDHLYFRAGQQFAGMLHPLGDGLSSAPIVVSSFGSGDRPRLTGDGEIATVLLENVSFWTVRDLEITNTALEEGKRNGILVEATRSGEIIRGITIEHVHISDVRGLTGEDNAAKDTGGIGVFAPELDHPAHFDGLLIRDCTIEHVDNIGIWLNTYPSRNPASPAWTDSHNEGVQIIGNTISNTGRNAIILRDSQAPLIEGNTVTHASARHHGNAIFTRSTRDAIIRHNEVSFTGTEPSGENAAFDADIDSIHTIIENNWSHDNQGGLFSLCNNPADDDNVTDDTVVRFNVSENDGIRAFGFSGGVTHSKVYNNTVFIGAGRREAIVEARPFSKVKPRYADGALFSRNMFILEESGVFDFGGARHLLFDANCYLGKSSAHPAGETDAVIVLGSLAPPSSPARSWQELGKYRAAARACGVINGSGPRVQRATRHGSYIPSTSFYGALKP